MTVAVADIVPSLSFDEESVGAHRSGAEERMKKEEEEEADTNWRFFGVFSIMAVVFPNVEKARDCLRKQVFRRANSMGSTEESFEGADGGVGMLTGRWMHHQVSVRRFLVD